MTETTYIYALVDPRDESIRYVGKANKPEYRLAQHLADRKNNRDRVEWLSALEEQGLRPMLKILESVPVEAWKDAECHWIDLGYSRGWPLTNAVAGGGGLTEGIDRQLDFTFVRRDIGETLWERFDSLPELRKLLIASLVIQASLEQSKVAQDIGFIDSWSPAVQLNAARSMARKLIEADREECYRLIGIEKKKSLDFDVCLYQWEPDSNK